MRICLLAWGSQGDVQPLVTLGRGLRAAGYEVGVAAGRDFTPTITTAGLTADPFDIDIAEATQSDLGRRWLEGSSGGIRQESRLMRDVVESFAPIAADGLARMADCYDATSWPRSRPAPPPGRAGPVSTRCDRTPTPGSTWSPGTSARPAPTGC